MHACHQLLAISGEYRNLVVGVLHHVDIHQLSKLRDVLVALVFERRGRGVRRCRYKLLVDLGDLLQRRVGSLHVVGDALLCLAAPPLARS